MIRAGLDLRRASYHDMCYLGRVNVRSLGLATDLALAAFDGVIEHRGEYIVARTPSNPHFYWGNFILFPEPPTDGVMARWLRIFEDEIGAATPHRLFAWDHTDGRVGAVEPFLAEGFEVDSGTALTATSVTKPPHARDDLEVRPVRGDDEWAAATDLQVAAFTRRYEDKDMEAFVVPQMRRYRSLVEQGRGEWFGAFQGPRILGTLGVFRAGDIGRFQLVGTHPDAQGRGVCRTLVYEASRRTLEAGARTLVMCADTHYHAARVYESVGFVPTEQIKGLLRA